MLGSVMEKTTSTFASCVYCMKGDVQKYKEGMAHAHTALGPLAHKQQTDTHEALPVGLACTHHKHAHGCAVAPTGCAHTHTHAHTHTRTADTANRFQPD
mmetsp:Transcript_9749/g.20812  ORF Transcript_9749/g.20812 Transcript_9749/m.20812 type:complete len:99 (-) Transcript_9749:637-933(-)